VARDLARRTQFHPPASDRPLLEVHGATVDYGRHGLGRSRGIRAVDDVSFAIKAGRSLGLVGESGCGKTTLGRAILGLTPLTQGGISLAASAPTSRMRFAARLARSAQMVFQDPYASLDPRQKILGAVAEPMTVHGIGAATDRTQRARQLLERVGIDAQFADAYPHQLSGGQRQRVCIARALAVAPQLIICDEPTSALDVSIQAQVVELLRDLQEHE
jgi:peptide/nickel transport system ATP-binding protein